MVSLPPAGGTGKKINGASLFGKDRYAQYINEMNSQGTIEGIPLTKSERKEGFKSRDTKLNFEKFVGRIFSKKTSTPKSKVDGESSGPIPGQKLLMGKNINFSSKPFTAPDIPEPEPATQTQSQGAAEKEDFEGVGDKIDELIAEIREENKADRADAEKERKRLEDEKRAKKEEMKEKIKSFIAAPIKKAMAPVTNIFKKIWDGLKTILFSKVLMKLVDWFSDPKNKKKIDSLGKFIKDFWPAIVSGFLLFGTGLGGLAGWFLGSGVQLIGKLVGLVAKLAVAAAKLGWGAAKWAAKNPLAAALIVLAGWGISKILGGQLDKEEKDGEKEFKNLQKQDPENKDKAPDDSDTKPTETQSDTKTTTTETQEKPKSGGFFGGLFGGGDKQQSGDQPQKFNEGGVVGGKGGVDQVPAMLTKDESVLQVGARERMIAETGIDPLSYNTGPDANRPTLGPSMGTGAVNKWGEDTLGNMNAMGGGLPGLGGGGTGTGYHFGEQAKTKTFGGALRDLLSGDDGRSSRMTDPAQRMAGGGLVQHFKNGGKVGGGKVFDKSHYGTKGYQIGQIHPDTLVLSQTTSKESATDTFDASAGPDYDKFSEDINYDMPGRTRESVKYKQGSIVGEESFSQDIVSIGVPDLMEHKDQLLSAIHAIEGYEKVTINDVLKSKVNMPLDQYLPILMNSDAQRATHAKQDAARRRDMEIRGVGNYTESFSMGYGDLKVASKSKGQSNASAIGATKAGKASLQKLPVVLQQKSQKQTPPPSDGGDVPSIGSVDPQNSSLWVLKAMYNLGE